MVRNDTSLGSSLFSILFGSILLTLLLIILVFFRITGGVLLLGTFAVILYSLLTFRFKNFGYYAFFLFCFLYPSIQLYTGFTQFGVILDSLLLFTVFIGLVKHRQDVNSLKDVYTSKLFWIWTIWLVSALFIQALNFDGVNWMSFIYGIRRVYLNPVGLVLLNIIFIRTKRDFKIALAAAIGGLLLLGLVAERQSIFGFNSFENALLSTEFGRTHLIAGTTRYWGGFTDAAGSGVGLALGIIAAIPFLVTKGSLSKRTSVVITMFLLFHASLISGTRAGYGSIAIGATLIALFYLRGNRQFLTISSLGISALILRFTNFGNGIGVIRRVRSAFNPQDESLLVRLVNREKLNSWLANHPFGGGIGGTYFDRRFQPDSFLSTFPPDGLYVQVKAELGFLGSYLFQAILLVIAVYMIIKAARMPRNSDSRLWMTICLALFAGARVSDYAQMVSFQFPVVNLLFLTMVGFEKWESWPSIEIFEKKKSAPLF